MCFCNCSTSLKHTTTLFALSSDHYILSREWRVVVDQVQTIIMIEACGAIGVTELLIMRDHDYGRMCFKSVKTLGALHSQLRKKPRPSASAFSTAKNVELLGLYPILSRHKPRRLLCAIQAQNK